MRILFLSLFLITLSACGQKGALYIATPEQIQETTERNERIRLKKMKNMRSNQISNPSISTPDPSH